MQNVHRLYTSRIRSSNVQATFVRGGKYLLPFYNDICLVTTVDNTCDCAETYLEATPSQT